MAPNVVAPHTAKVGQGPGGVLTFKNGILWAGFTNLSFSADSGKTWTSTNLPNTQITALSFLNENDGVVSSNIPQHLFTSTTTDGGKTWSTPINQGFNQLVYAAPSKVYGVNFRNCYESGDKGISWEVMDSIPGTDLGVADDGHAVILSSVVAYLDASCAIIGDNSGVKFKTMPGFVDYDSYSIGIDSCNDSTLYVVSENVYGDVNTPYAKIFRSTNQGESWQSTFSHPLDYLSSSFSTAAHALYAATRSDGIIRSIDRGLTWENIGGPGNVADSRSICAINDNVIFALDSNGNVWATFNSGGFPISLVTSNPVSLLNFGTIQCDSATAPVQFNTTACPLPHVTGWAITGADSSSFNASNLSNDSISVTLYSKTNGNKQGQLLLYIDNGYIDTIALSGNVINEPNNLTLSAASLFSSDTISCDSLMQTASFIRSGCSPPSVRSYVIVGQDSLAFRVINLFPDSITLTFSGDKIGKEQADLIIALDNGSNDTIQLTGYVNLFHSPLAFSIPNVQTDTLGATVSIPITLNGLERAENVDLILHYDGTVDYLGSFSPSGVLLDVPGQQWPGRSELSITGATSGAALGYAKFNVFNDSSEAAHATFDSVTVLTQVSSCQYSMPEPATSTITTLSGCAVPILSQLIHFGVDPVFSVMPNPANGNVWVSSSEDIGAATIEVYDMLGVKRSEGSAAFQKDTPVEQTLPDADGVYAILVKTTSGICSLRVVRRH